MLSKFIKSIIIKIIHAKLTFINVNNIIIIEHMYVNPICDIIDNMLGNLSVYVLYIIILIRYINEINKNILY
jgi:hypothetical protein